MNRKWGPGSGGSWGVRGGQGRSGGSVGGGGGVRDGPDMDIGI